MVDLSQIALHPQDCLTAILPWLLWR